VFQTKVAEKIRKHFIFNEVSEDIVLNEIMWKTMVEPDRP